MPDSQTQTTTARTDALFDRYTLPKVALTVILFASLVGTWLTTTLNGDAGPVFAVVKWAWFVAMGVLLGGFVWKHYFVRPADIGEGAGDYCAEMYDRFDRLAASAVAVLVVGSLSLLWNYLDAFGPTALTACYAALLATWLCFVGATTYRSDAVEQQFRSPFGLGALGLSFAVVVATAVAEVALRGFDPLTAGVRIVHLLAFGVWLGGAVWNIFVAVPTGQRRSTATVVRAAGEQLERFRRAVRLIIPTLFLTGFYQAVDGIGTQVGTYVGSTVGLAILAKIGCIGLLVVIFKLCPMWRACSPIEGVCELDEVGGPDSDERRTSLADSADAGTGVTRDD